MRRGFTIIELLVASLLLGMLVTILTMMFNQSSIAWRTGVASISDLDDMRDNVSAIREEADNAFIWNDTLYRTMGLWDSSGKLRSRACDASDSNVQTAERITFLKRYLTPSSRTTPEDFKTIGVGSGTGSKGFTSYTVNVMSGGPNNDVDDWEAIWSYPDDLQ